MEDSIFQCMDMDFMIRFLRGIQKLLGENCEIIVHDYRKGYDHTIVYEINAGLSGRRIGDSPRGGMIAAYGENISGYSNSSIFFYEGGQKGQYFKSCTTLVSDEKGRIIGSVCLNIEISQSIIFQGLLNRFLSEQKHLQLADLKEPDIREDILTKNIDDILEYYIQQVEEIIQKPAAIMTKEERKIALDFLDKRGVFKISKASNVLCEAFKISRYTLYACLDEVRNARETKKEE